MRTALIVAAVLVLCAALFGAPQTAHATGGYATGNVNMRTGPSTKHRRIVVVPRGAPVSIGRCARGNRWCHVRYRGHSGWVSARYLSRGVVYVRRTHPRYVRGRYYGRYYHGRRYYGRRYYYPRYGYHGGYYRHGGVGIGFGYGYGGYYHGGSGVGFSVRIR